MDVKTVGHVLGDVEMSVKMVGSARATGVSVADGQITLCLEADVVVEMSAFSRMWVKAYDMECEVLEDLDDYSSSESDSDTSSSSSSSTSCSGSDE
jgi:D-serine dehydratase